MKKTLLFIATLITNLIWSQSVETKIKNVENGLTLQKTVPKGDAIHRKSIFQEMQIQKVYGASVAVVHDGKIDWSKAYGTTDSDRRIPITNETLFQCGSIGKVITALAALKLVAAGELNLDENVNNKLKNWKLPENKNTAIRPVTLRYLLSHSSGLTDNYGFLGYEPKNALPTLVQILNNDAPANNKKELVVQTIPGKIEKYSGGGYLIIQLLIQDISGQSFDDFVQYHIFNPIGMTHSTYEYYPDKNKDVTIATGHRSKGRSLKNKRYHLYPEKAAAGPWTTAEDIAKLIIEIQRAIHGKTTQLLKQELIEEFLKPQINNKGLGVNLKGLDKPMAFWHAGQNLGYMGLVYGLTEKEEGAVILLNSDDGEKLIQQFITSVAHAYNWPVMKSYKTLDIPQKLKSTLVGTYRNDDASQELHIEQKREELFVRSADSRKGIQLYRIGEDHYTFRNSQDYYRLTFNSDATSNMLMYTESIGNTVVLKKVE